MRPGSCKKPYTLAASLSGECSGEARNANYLAKIENERSLPICVIDTEIPNVLNIIG